MWKKISWGALAGACLAGVVTIATGGTAGIILTSIALGAGAGAGGTKIIDDSLEYKKIEAQNKSKSIEAIKEEKDRNNQEILEQNKILRSSESTEEEKIMARAKIKQLSKKQDQIIKYFQLQRSSWISRQFGIPNTFSLILFFAIIIFFLILLVKIKDSLNKIFTKN